MKSFAAGVCFLCLMCMANVVAAGVFLVLRQAIPSAIWQDNLLLMVTVGLVAIASAMAFLRGSIEHTIKVIHWMQRTER